jgi:hypothetical protein
MNHVEVLVAVVWQPDVGEAWKKNGNMYWCPQGVYISFETQGMGLDILKNSLECWDKCGRDCSHQWQEHLGVGNLWVQVFWSPSLSLCNNP